MIRRLLPLLLLVACGSDDPCALPDGTGVDPDGPFCDQLSSYRLDDLIPFDVNTPLFADYAAKDRSLYLPPGTSMEWSDFDAFTLPVGALLVKTFSYPADRRDPASPRRLLETRLLVRGTDEWRGVSYVYDDDQREARRAVAGATVESQWIHDDGATRTNRYVVPNQNQCKNCHAEHDDTIDVLGPKARHLNRPGQLQALIDRGALAGAPPPAQWPRPIAAFDPASGTLEERARVWLDINCSACHNARGGSARTSGLYLDLSQTDLHELGRCKAPVAAGRGSGGRAFGIVPGQPDASILVFRLESTEADIKMPELGRNLVDAEGVALIREWITQMPGTCD